MQINEDFYMAFQSKFCVTAEEITYSENNFSMDGQ